MEVFGNWFDEGQIADIWDQTGDAMAYKYAFGEDVTDEEVINAYFLEVEEMMPILSMMVDRCAMLFESEMLKSNLCPCRIVVKPTFQ